LFGYEGDSQHREGQGGLCASRIFTFGEVGRQQFPCILKTAILIEEQGEMVIGRFFQLGRRLKSELLCVE
jgi:hypothetical protein